MQRRHIFDVFLMRIKCVVENLIIFDLIIDTNQKKSKSNFSCSEFRLQSTGLSRLLPLISIKYMSRV